MKTLALALVALLFAGASSAFADGTCPGVNDPQVPKAGYQQLTVSNTAVGLTVPARARMAVAKVATAAMRYRDDGTNPTATVGMPLAVGDSLVICGRAMREIKFIRTAVDGTLDVSYYGD